MSDEAAAGPGPAWERPSLAHEAFVEAGPGLADRQGTEEVGNVEGSETLSRGQPVPQPGSPGFSTAPPARSRRCSSWEALSAFPRPQRSHLVAGSPGLRGLRVTPGDLRGDFLRRLHGDTCC